MGLSAAAGASTSLGDGGQGAALTACAGATGLGAAPGGWLLEPPQTSSPRPAFAMSPRAQAPVFLKLFLTSCTMRSISSLESRPFSLVIVILAFLPVVLSSALTVRMPLASMSKTTLIWRGWAA